MNVNIIQLLLTSLFIFTESKDNFKVEKQKCFKDENYCIYKSELTWYEAKKVCNENLAILVTIINRAESNVIKKELDEGKYWIGLNSLNSNGEYMWLDETDTNFDELNKDSTDMNSREKCVYIDTKLTIWKDAHCEEKMKFICKKFSRKVRPFPILPTGNCPSDWYQFEPFCYKVFNEPLSWNDAKTNCRLQGKTGYDLASIHNFRQNMLLTSILQNDTWIGGTFLKSSNKKIWSDNTPFDYSVSIDSEENTKNLCFQMLSDNSKQRAWNAVNCTEEKPYICQTYISNLIPHPPTLAPERCQNSAHQLIGYRGDCYYLHNQSMTWIDGEKFCESFGPHLAIISDAKESAFINFYLGLSDSDVWISLTGNQSQYKWLYNWPLNYTNWMDDQPINLNNVIQCGLIDGKTGKWKVAECNEKHWLLCKLTDIDPPVLQEVERSCPEHLKDWKKMENGLSCYKVFNNELDWISAAKDCQKYGANLISFHSIDEVKSTSQDLKNLKSIWIGLSRVKDEPYKWRDESLLDFVNWKDKPTGEGCVEMSLPDQTWKNVDCNSRNSYICGAKKVVLTEEETNNNNNKKNVSNPGLSAGSVAAICLTVIIVALMIVSIVLWKKGMLKNIFR